MKNLFARFVREENGQDLIEYALLAALISIGSIAAMGTVKTAINGVFSDRLDRAHDRVVVGCPARSGARCSHRAGSVSQEEFTIAVSLVVWQLQSQRVQRPTCTSDWSCDERSGPHRVRAALGGVAVASGTIQTCQRCHPVLRQVLAAFDRCNSFTATHVRHARGCATPASPPVSSRCLVHPDAFASMRSPGAAEVATRAREWRTGQEQTFHLARARHEAGRGVSGASVSCSFAASD